MRKVKVYFLGVLGIVIGFKFIIEIFEINILVDCGVF